MTDKIKSYMTNLLPNCMLTYQFIEEGLRMSLYRYHAITKNKINGVIAYSPPTEAIHKAAMGRLIHYFKEFNEDKDLISLLKAVKAKRDHIAHEAYLLTYEEQNDENFIDKLHKETEGSLSEAKKCLDLVHIEVQRLEDLANELYSKNSA